MMIRSLSLRRLNAIPVPFRIITASQLTPTSSWQPSPALPGAAKRSLTRSFHQTRPNRADNDSLGTRRYLYPERLLVYHAGTGRITFLASLKMTTVFVMGFFCFVVTPAYFSAPDMPNIRAIAMAGCGLIPFVFVAYTTAPIVTYMHIRLPIYARQKRQSLEQWVKAGVNKDTELELSSMTLLARPKQTAIKIGHLMPVKKRLGLANYALSLGATSQPGPLIRRGGKWWQSKPLKTFNIQGFNRDAREGWVWDELINQVERRAKMKNDGKG